MSTNPSLPSKVCAVCSILFQPRRGSTNLYESARKFAVRKTCSNQCGGILRFRQTKERIILKSCEHCRCIMPRKMYGTVFRKAESVGYYYRRRFCSRRCVYAHRASVDRARTPHHIRSLARQAITIKCCAKCKRTEKRLAVHHISGRATHLIDNDPTNLQVLCMSCHAKHHAILRRQKCLQTALVERACPTASSHAAQ